MCLLQVYCLIVSASQPADMRLTWSTLPTLSVWPRGPPWRVGEHKEPQTAIGPSQPPSRSLETARPVGRASALDFCPGAKVSGSQTHLLTPWYSRQRRVFRDDPFPTSVGESRLEPTFLYPPSSLPPLPLRDHEPP